MFDWVLVLDAGRVGGERNTGIQEVTGESTGGGSSKRVESGRNRGKLCNNF